MKHGCFVAGASAMSVFIVAAIFLLSGSETSVPEGKIGFIDRDGEFLWLCDETNFLSSATAGLREDGMDVDAGSYLANFYPVLIRAGKDIGTRYGVSPGDARFSGFALMFSGDRYGKIPYFKLYFRERPKRAGNGRFRVDRPITMVSVLTSLGDRLDVRHIAGGRVSGAGHTEPMFDYELSMACLPKRVWRLGFSTQPFLRDHEGMGGGFPGESAGCFAFVLYGEDGFGVHEISEREFDSLPVWDFSPGESVESFPFSLSAILERGRIHLCERYGNSGGRLCFHSFLMQRVNFPNGHRFFFRALYVLCEPGEDVGKKVRVDLSTDGKVLPDIKLEELLGYGSAGVTVTNMVKFLDI